LSRFYLHHAEIFLFEQRETMTKHPLFCSAVSIFYVLLGSLIFAQEQRTWTDDTGKFKIEAKLQRVEDDKVFLKKTDGKISSIPLAKL